MDNKETPKDNDKHNYAKRLDYYKKYYIKKKKKVKKLEIIHERTTITFD